MNPTPEGVKSSRMGTAGLASTSTDARGPGFAAAAPSPEATLRGAADSQGARPLISICSVSASSGR